MLVHIAVATVLSSEVRHNNVSLFEQPPTGAILSQQPPLLPLMCLNAHRARKRCPSQRAQSHDHSVLVHVAVATVLSSEVRHNNVSLFEQPPTGAILSQQPPLIPLMCINAHRARKRCPSQRAQSHDHSVLVHVAVATVLSSEVRHNNVSVRAAAPGRDSVTTATFASTYVHQCTPCSQTLPQPASAVT